MKHYFILVGLLASNWLMSQSQSTYKLAFIEKESNSEVLINIDTQAPIITNENLRPKIKWGDYKEPNGRLLYLKLNPDLIFRESKTYRLETELTYRNLKEHSIIHGQFSNLYSYHIIEDGIDATQSINFTTEFNYSKYLNSRRGLFIDSRNDLFTNRRIESEDWHFSSFTNSLGIGIGRLEETSTVNQAYRIIENVDQLYNLRQTENQEEIFALATLLRELDYHFVRDPRRRMVNQMALFLDHFKNRSYDLNQTQTTAQLIDGYLNSRYRPFIGGFGNRFTPFNRADLEYWIDRLDGDPIGEYFYGQKARVSIERWSNTSPSDSLSTNSVNFEFMKSFGISNAVKINTYGLTRHFFNTSEFDYGYKVGASAYYTPDARTSLGISLMRKGYANDTSKIEFQEVVLTAAYYLNYDTVVSAWLQHRFVNEILGGGNTFHFSINHYIY